MSGRVTGLNEGAHELHVCVFGDITKGTQAGARSSLGMDGTGVLCIVLAQVCAYAGHVYASAKRKRPREKVREQARVMWPGRGALAAPAPPNKT